MDSEEATGSFQLGIAEYQRVVPAKVGLTANINTKQRGRFGFQQVTVKATVHRIDFGKFQTVSKRDNT